MNELLKNKAKITIPIDKQSWRFFLEWQVNAAQVASTVVCL
jgi:hypothetical protein